MTNFSLIGSVVSEPKAENNPSPFTWHIAVTTVYALTRYTVVNITTHNPLPSYDAFADETLHDLVTVNTYLGNLCLTSLGS